MKKILVIFGTRPEAIKLAPIIINSRKWKSKIKLKVCITAQHREMLDQVLKFFDIKPDYDLNLMTKNQTLSCFSSRSLIKVSNLLNQLSPDYIMIQGDTTTSFISSLAAFYNKIKIIHIEAGLRTYNKYSPFPEEINRVLISHIADYHFAPTEIAKKNLLKEGINKNVFVVGNTIVDALNMTLDIIKNKGEGKYLNFFNFLNFSKKIILVTAHRRESFGEGISNICEAIKIIATNRNDVEIVYPVHLNPNIRNVVIDELKNFKNVFLIEPLEYSYFIWLMSKSYLILTDSGGVQEEVAALKKPCIIMRELTERIEVVKAGIGKIVGTDVGRIVREVNNLLDSKLSYSNISKIKNPYGDGNSSLLILEKLLN